MKNELLLRWLLITEQRRWVSVIGLLAGIALLASCWWLVPARAEQQLLQKEAIRQQLYYRQLLMPLREQPALQALQRRNQQMLANIVREGAPFSLYTLLQRSGGELEQWQPDRQDSQLQLWLSWPQLKLVFAYLAACEPAPALVSFHVQRKEDRLHATFHLVFDHEASLD